MAGMHMEREKRERYLPAAVGFFALLLVYGVWIWNAHYSNDAFNVFANGTGAINLDNGRLLSWLLYSVIDRVCPGLYRQMRITQALLLCVSTACGYGVYRRFEGLSDHSALSRGLIGSAVLLLFVNVSFMEGWFGFSELCFGACVHTLLGFSAFFLFCRGHRGSERALLGSGALLLLAMSMYQAYLGIYVALCTAYVLCACRGAWTRRDVRVEIQMVLMAALCAAVNLAAVKGLAAMGLMPQSSRVSGLSLDQVRRIFFWVLEAQGEIFADFMGFLPRGAMPVAVMAMAAALILFLKGRTLAVRLWTVLLVIGCWLTVFMPHVFSSVLWLTPRSICGFFALMAGVWMLAAFCPGGKNVRRLILLGEVAFLVISAIQIETLEAENIALNRIDQEAVYAVQRRIDAYESESGNGVDTIAVCYDELTEYGYPSIRYTRLDMNVRGFSTAWEDVNMINFYTGRQYARREMTQEEQTRLFGSAQFDTPDLSAQLLFEGNTAYLLVY